MKIEDIGLVSYEDGIAECECGWRGVPTFDGRGWGRIVLRCPCCKRERSGRTLPEGGDR